MRIDAHSLQPRFEPSLSDWPDAGAYQLWLRVAKARWIPIGRLGRFLFPPGVYVYTGRAARGLRARVTRHARGARAKHWHIDYLLAAKDVRPERIVLASRDSSMECSLNQSVGENAACPVRGFGSSDCREGCPAHLWLLLAGARLRKATGRA
jgi:Uri superfamily endonuclease